MFTLAIVIAVIALVSFSFLVVSSNRNERNAQFLRDWDSALLIERGYIEERRNAFYRSYFTNVDSSCFHDGSMIGICVGRMSNLEDYGLDISMPTHREVFDLLLKADKLTSDSWEVPQGLIYAWFYK